jgi:hypothetical protein
VSLQVNLDTATLNAQVHQEQDRFSHTLRESKGAEINGESHTRLIRRTRVRDSGSARIAKREVPRGWSKTSAA